MTRIREEVTIAAPAAAVWEAVHEDAEKARHWSGGQMRLTHLDGAPGPGTRVRYDISLPAGIRTSLTVRHDTWSPSRLCAGSFVDGPLRGTWSYRYTQRAGATTMVYEMDYELGGLLRLGGGAFRGQYAQGVREGLARLKDYLESGPGQGPEARRRAPPE